MVLADTEASSSTTGQPSPLADSILSFDSTKSIEPSPTGSKSFSLAIVERPKSPSPAREPAAATGQRKYTALSDSLDNFGAGARPLHELLEASAERPMSPAPVALLNPNATPFVSNWSGNAESPEHHHPATNGNNTADYNWRHYGLTTPPGFSSEPLLIEPAIDYVPEHRFVEPYSPMPPTTPVRQLPFQHGYVPCPHPASYQDMPYVQNPPIMHAPVH